MIRKSGSVFKGTKISLPRKLTSIKDPKEFDLRVFDFVKKLSSLEQNRVFENLRKKDKKTRSEESLLQAIVAIKVFRK